MLQVDIITDKMHLPVVSQEHFWAKIHLQWPFQKSSYLHSQHLKKHVIFVGIYEINTSISGMKEADLAT